MRRLKVILALILTSPAWAQDGPDLEAAAVPFFAPGTYGEAFDDTGLTQGCADEGGQMVCTVTSRGANLIARAGETPDAVMAVLMALPLNTAVNVSGDITSMGDITAEIVLSTVRLAEADPYATLAADMQGMWVSDDDAQAAFEVVGTQMVDSYAGEVQASSLLTFAAECPDGLAGVGPVMIAQVMGDDPGEMACYAIVSLADGALEMSLMGGTGNTLSYTRQ
ncbi:MAG: hypothetical protein ACRCSU_11150 [Paracoccaceae bacterium]